jgi:hypothetical protein
MSSKIRATDCSLLLKILLFRSHQIFQVTKIAGERNPFVNVSIELPARSANQLTKSSLLFQDSGFREVLLHQTPTMCQIEHDNGHSTKSDWLFQGFFSKGLV